jgi:hypothetical protein
MGRCLVLTLGVPAQVYFGKGELGDQPLDLGNARTSPPCAPPWESDTDLLIHQPSKTLVGIACDVSRQHRDVEWIKSICASLDSSVVKYVSSSDLEHSNLYDDCEIDHVELRWSDMRPDKYERALLLEGLWYYNEDRSKEKLLAFGFADIDNVLRDYKIQMPQRFLCESFLPTI